MKLKHGILVAIVIVTILVAGLAVFFGTKQAAIGTFESQATCETYAKSQFCSGGFYACTPCSSTTLQYTMTFADGTKTSTVWGSDCVAKSSTAANDGAHTLCSGGTTATAASTSLVTGNVVATTPTKTCSYNQVCSGPSSVQITFDDCTGVVAQCSGAYPICTNGRCAAPATTQTASAAPVAAPVDHCANVPCPSYCDAQYTNHLSGTCDPNTGACIYASLETNSPTCLPTPTTTGATVTQTTGSPTGAVVSVPAINNVTAPPAITAEAQPGPLAVWFGKYGYYAGGGIIIILIASFLAVDANEKKGKRRRR